MAKLTPEEIAAAEQAAIAQALAEKEQREKDEASRAAVDAAAAEKAEADRIKDMQVLAAAGTIADRDRVVRTIARKFEAAIPPAARSSGHYAVPADGELVPVPDGVYRVTGGDWLFTFHDCRWLECARATEPHFGGDQVIAVANG